MNYRLMIACFLLPDLLLAQDCELTNLDDVLAHYVEARGGNVALDSQTALRLRSTNHEGEWNPEFDYRTMKPGYMWIRATYDDGVSVEEGFDGERGWEKWDEKDAEYVDGDAAKALNQGAMSPVHLYGLNHMEALGATVRLDGCQSIDDRLYYAINVVSRFGSDIDYYIATDSFRMERARTVRPLHPTQDPTPITIEERWSDFRFVAGVLHPFGYSNWNAETNERLNWLEVHSIERDPDANVQTFAIPDN